jgi:hypothetical protein
LEGVVGNEQFARLTEGQHPTTEAQLVRHQPSKTRESANYLQFNRFGWKSLITEPE